MLKRQIKNSVFMKTSHVSSYTNPGLSHYKLARDDFKTQFELGLTYFNNTKKEIEFRFKESFAKHYMCIDDRP